MTASLPKRFARPRGYPTASSSRVSSRMRTQLRRDTKVELAIRSILHRAGLRYRVDSRPVRDLPRRADVVFVRRKLAVFVDGCFWHGCPMHSKRIEHNRRWWRTKISRNEMRDRDTDKMLRDRGWTVLRIWEHEDATEAARRIQNLLGHGSP